MAKIAAQKAKKMAEELIEKRDINEPSRK